MSKLEAKLSADAIGNIAISRVENDFNFIAGDNRYSCPWFVAAFLHPKLHSFTHLVHQFANSILK
jgi:hypothetical protein